MNTKSKMFKKGKKVVIAIAIGCLFITTSSAQDGEALFKACSICHTIGGGKLIGPDLMGILDRRPEAELIKYVKNPAEFGVVLMPPQNLTDAEILAIIDFIYATAPGAEEEEEVVLIFEEEPEEEFEFSENDYLEHADKMLSEGALVEESEEVILGAHLFDGSTRFENGGASCITCHNVSNKLTMQGGLLAKDLTDAFSRIGGERGISGMVTGLPYPAMKAAYGDNTITESELAALVAYFKYADSHKAHTQNTIGEASFFFGGSIGLLILMVLIAWIWAKRKKSGVKDEIYNRQIKSI